MLGTAGRIQVKYLLKALALVGAGIGATVYYKKRKAKKAQQESAPVETRVAPTSKKPKGASVDLYNFNPGILFAF